MVRGCLGWVGPHKRFVRLDVLVKLRPNIIPAHSNLEQRKNNIYTASLLHPSPNHVLNTFFWAIFGPERPLFYTTCSLSLAQNMGPPKLLLNVPEIPYHLTGPPYTELWCQSSVKVHLATLSHVLNYISRGSLVVT